MRSFIVSHFSAIAIFSNTKDIFRIDLDLDPRRQSYIDLSNGRRVTFHSQTIGIQSIFKNNGLHTRPGLLNFTVGEGGVDEDQIKINVNIKHFKDHILNHRRLLQNRQFLLL